MVGVVFIFVREDAGDVEALAEAFDEAGYSINGSENADDAVSIVVWSRSAMRSDAFRKAAERALRSDRVVVASLAALPHNDARAPVANISAWDGNDPRGLAPLFDIVSAVLAPVSPSVIVLPSRPLYEDAEFVEAPLQITDGRREGSRSRAAWEAPIPAKVLRPVHEQPAAPKLGASSPRRDFRRAPQRSSNSRAHAALMFAVITLTAGSLLITAAQNLSLAPQAKAQAVETGGVSLTSASAEAVGLQDNAPAERARMFEPPVQAGHAGFEPPSARTVRRANYQP